MRKIVSVLVAGLLCLASWQSNAQSVLGFPPGMFGSRAALNGAVSTYQGPGDVFSTSVYGWYSCAMSYNSAWAVGGNNLCKIVDTSTGATSCIIKTGANGRADLTSVVCPTSAPTVSVTTWCTVTNVGGCSITTAYDQSGNSRDALNATLSSMPPLILSSTPTGTLPGIGCNTSSTHKQLLSSGTFSPSIPITLSQVYIRTGGTGAPGGNIGFSTTLYSGPYTANLATVSQGNVVTTTATDSAWHSLNALANGNGTASAVNVDGTDVSGAAGVNAVSGANIAVCNASGTEMNPGVVAEAGIWNAISTSTIRNNLSTNQHSRYAF